MSAKLYIFSISHYCEKARWALDYFGIDYDLVHLAPGLHAEKAKKLGTNTSTLPILETGKDVIQGSSEIIDWAENNTQLERSLTPSSDLEECLKIEKRIDDVIGVHVRRMYYSEAMVEFPETVRPIFTKDLPFAQSLMIKAAWPKVRDVMIKKMDLGFEQGEQSKAILESELNWLDQLLEDGREYLIADGFTRADISAAALMARLANAQEHPAHEFMVLPPRAQTTADEWHDRPSMQLVRRVYAEHRNE